MKRRKKPWRWAVLATVALLPARLFAGDVEQAKNLFDQGIADLEAGLLDKACPAIDLSFRLDPRPGTLFALAECEAQRGRLATAVARYTQYLALYKQFNPQKQAEQKERAETSRAQIDSLGPQVPTLTLRLPEGAPEDVEVKMEGEVVPHLSLGTPLAANPGESLVTTQAPGGPVALHRVTLQKGERKELVLTVRAKGDPDPARTASALPSSASAAVSTSSPLGLSPSSRALAGPSPDTSPVRTGAIVAAALGGAGIAVGAVTGILALDRKAAVDRVCTRTQTGTDCATLEGVSAGQELKILGTTSTAAFAVGALGLAAAGVLFIVKLSAGPKTPAAPAVKAAVTPGGLTIFGRF